MAEKGAPGFFKQANARQSGPGYRMIGFLKMARGFSLLVRDTGNPSLPSCFR
jgi:hypothetical protein